MRHKARQYSAGFSLVEVLVVVGVIGVLAGIIVPVMSSIHAEANSTKCLSNLRQQYGALETYRASRKKTDLPYAAPLPLPPDQVAQVPSLQQTLAAIIPVDSDVWFCPGDHTEDSQEIGTSYIYVPGAFMLLEPPELALTVQQNIEASARKVTGRFSGGYLRRMPVITDNEDFHSYGERYPRNAVFYDGNARPVNDKDGIMPDDEYIGPDG